MLSIKSLTIHLASKSICKDLNFEIQPGQIWGVLGKNGIGKTTLLHTLAGLLKPASGDILFQGKSWPLYHPKQKAQRIGILFQKNDLLFPYSVWDYCLLGRYPYKKSFHDNLEDQQITQNALKIMSVEKEIDKNIFHLSGGEWQRVNLAKLLTQDPDIYLMDEPLNHLDLHYQIQVLNYFHRLSPHKAIVMILHDINLAYQFCTNFLMLLGEGETLSGGQEIMTEENLTRLYGHGIHLHSNSNQTFWMVDI